MGENPLAVSDSHLTNFKERTVSSRDGTKQEIVIYYG